MSGYLAARRWIHQDADGERGVIAARNPTDSVAFGIWRTSRRSTNAPSRRFQPAPDYLQGLRKQAFEEFQALPIPSQETEEWRYTDLSAFDLTFEPHRPRVTRAHHFQPDAGRHRRRLLRPGRSDQRHPDLVEPGCTSWSRPTGRSSPRCTGRSAPAARSCTCPTAFGVELPIQALTYLDADGAAVFPHTLIVVGAQAEVTFIDRYVVARPDRRALRRRRRDRLRRRRRRSATSRSRNGARASPTSSVQRARLGRDAEFHSLVGRVRRRPRRNEVESVLAEPGASSEMLGAVLRRRLAALRPPDAAGPRGAATARATCCTRAR